MISFSRCLVFIVIMAPTLFAQERVSLFGLDRLYFEHTGDKIDRSPVPSYLAKFLPTRIKGADFSPREVLNKVNDGAIEYDVEIRDFRLPLRESSVRLRQIILGKQSERITSLWLALYDHGYRSDTWFYRADPDRTDHKILPNYEIVDASATNEGFDLRLLASMFRPQGDYSVGGRTFHFARRDNVLEFSGVLNNFGFFRSYDTIEISMMIEHISGAQIELLDFDSVREQTLRKCKFRLFNNDDWVLDWTKMEREASCIAEKENRQSSYRDPDQPSFVERGWKAR
jgi:hypothetical protein